jgi:hypothetical protein
VAQQAFLSPAKADDARIMLRARLVRRDFVMEHQVCQEPEPMASTEVILRRNVLRAYVRW